MDPWIEGWIAELEGSPGPGGGWVVKVKVRNPTDTDFAGNGCYVIVMEHPRGRDATTIPHKQDGEVVDAPSVRVIHLKSHAHKIVRFGPYAVEPVESGAAVYTRVNSSTLESVEQRGVHRPVFSDKPFPEVSLLSVPQDEPTAE